MVVIRSPSVVKLRVMAQSKIIAGNILFFPKPDKVSAYVPGYLVINEKGKIEEVGNLPIPEKYRGIATLDYSGFWILPGFIDLHSHIPQIDERGRYSRGLLSWLDKHIYPAEKRFEDPEIARDASRRFFTNLLRSGTTLAVLYSSLHLEATDIAFDEAKKIGIRAIIGKVQMDQNVPDELREDRESSIRESIELIEKWHGYDNNRLMYVFSPRFAPATSEALLKEIAVLAKRYDVYIQTHLSENKDEVEWVKELYPKYGSYTAFYEAMGILGKKTLLAHSIYLSEEEYKILKETESRVVHCPTANLFLHSGRMNLSKMKEYGITIGLGTDIGAGLHFSLLNVMRNMYYLNSVSPTEAFYYATRSGAIAIGLEDEIGLLEPGFDADLVVLDSGKLERGLMNDIDRTLSAFMFKGDERVVKAVFVRGRRLYP